MNENYNENFRGKVGEKIPVPFNEDAYKRILGNANVNYPDEQIQANLKDRKKFDLHNRVKNQLEINKRIYGDKDPDGKNEGIKSKYHVKDGRLNRAFWYYLKDEFSDPANEEINREFVDGLNTPEGAQLFINKLVKEFLDQDISDLIVTNLDDMAEKYLQNPAMYSLLFVINDLFKDDASEKTPMYSIDPELKKVLKDKLVLLQDGQNIASAAALMASDAWALYDTDVMQNSDNLMGVMVSIPQERKGLEKKLKKEKNPENQAVHDELTAIYPTFQGYAGAFLDKASREKMRDKGLLKEGVTYSLDGKEVPRSEIANHADRFDDIKKTNIDNYYSLKARADEQIILSDYLVQMKKSQKAIWGKGSPEFRDLMDAIEQYQKACNSGKSGVGIDDKKVIASMEILHQKADAYLKTKEGKSLNDNGKIRLALVQNIYKSTENIKKERFAAAYKNALNNAGLTPPSDEEVKAKSENPQNKRVHEQCREFVKKTGTFEVQSEEFKKKYPSPKELNAGLKRVYFYFYDRSGTPEADKYNKQFQESLKTIDGQQQLLNKAVKTVLETPSEFFLARNLQEAALRYIEYPALSKLSYIVCDLLTELHKDNTPLKLDPDIEKALQARRSLMQTCADFEEAAYLMAREDWANYDIDHNKEDSMLAVGMVGSNNTMIENDPYRITPTEGKKGTELANMLGSRFNITLSAAGKELLDKGTKLFETGAELTLNGKKANHADALDKIFENKEKGLDPMNGIEVKYDEIAAKELKAKVARLDTGIVRIRGVGYKMEEARKGFSDEENERYKSDRKTMQDRADSLANGPEKIIAQMAVGAKDRIFEHVGRHRIYDQAAIDMKIMTFNRVLMQDKALGGNTIALEMSKKGITNQQQAAEFIKEFKFGKSMENAENNVKIFRTGQGQAIIKSEGKAQLKDFAIGDGARELCTQCTESIRAEIKALNEKQRAEALSHTKGIMDAIDKLPGGPGIGK